MLKITFLSPLFQFINNYFFGFIKEDVSDKYNYVNFEAKTNALALINF